MKGVALEEGLSSADILFASAYIIAAIVESANSDEVGFGSYCASILEELAAGDSTGVVLTLRLDSKLVWMIRTIAASVKTTNAITVEAKIGASFQYLSAITWSISLGSRGAPGPAPLP